jgi:hypothetical protein
LVFLDTFSVEGEEPNTLKIDINNNTIH